MSVTWVFYLLVQGSDPGFIDQEAYEKSIVDKHNSNGSSSSNASPIESDNMEIELEVPRRNKHKPHLDQEEEEEKEDGGAQGGEGDEEEKELDDDDVEIDLSFPEEEEDDGSAFLKWKAWPPMRAGYCKPAKRWVTMYDHFCPFLNTPIGERNHCRFWWFLLFQCGSVNWAIAIVHTGFIDHSWDGGAWMNVNGHALATAFFLYLTLLFIGPLFLFHCFLALCNITTYEFLRSDEVDYLRGTQDFDLPFARSFWFNVRFFCCEQVPL
jgi:hypothetical protein